MCILALFVALFKEKRRLYFTGTLVIHRKKDFLKIQEYIPENSGIYS
jgi:hypothetical protein